MEDEAGLIQAARRGAVEAFSQLVLQHQSHVRAYLGRYAKSQDVVDDLAQEVFLCAFRGLDRFQGDAPLRIWLFGIARHRALQYLREEARRGRREDQPLSHALAEWRLEGAERGEAEVERLEGELAALQSCLEALPKGSAGIVQEYYFGAQSLVQIARRMGKKENAVAASLFRIRRELGRCVRMRLSGMGK